MVSDISKKRLIFTVTSGRSGTGYLTRMLGFFPGVDSVHEEPPLFTDVMRQVQQDPKLAYDFWREKKLPAIEKYSAPIYIETSHIFSKGFLEPLLDMGITPDLIMLTRSEKEVASSLYALDCVPGRTEKGLRFLVKPDDPGVIELPDWKQLHSYQLCLWYCRETERRQAAYRDLVEANGGRVVSLDSEDMFSPDGLALQRLAEQLALPQLGLWGRFRFRKALRERVNAKSKRKQVPPLPDSEANDLETELDRIMSTS